MTSKDRLPRKMATGTSGNKGSSIDSRDHRFRLPGVRMPHSLIRRSGGALASTALATGLIVGGGAQAQAADLAPVSPLASHAGKAASSQAHVQHRRDGVAADLARAVSSGDITQEQADRFFARLIQRMG